jgi:hypothetical protein
MSQTPGNTISGAGGYGSGVLRPPGSNMWFFQWVGILGAGAVSLTVAGKLARPALAVLPGLSVRVGSLVTRPINWALYNAYSEMGDISDWARGEEMAFQPEITARPWMLPAGYPVMVPFPWFDIKAVSSGGGGGPPVIPNLHRPPPSIEETGEILSNPSIVVEVPSSPRRSTSKKAGKRRKSCPPGYRWNGRRCVKKG